MTEEEHDAIMVELLERRNGTQPDGSTWRFNARTVFDIPGTYEALCKALDAEILSIWQARQAEKG